MTLRVTRRDTLALMAASAALTAVPPTVSAAAAAGALLPVKTPGLDHLDVMVPDVEKSARFYMSVFKTSLHAQPFQGGQRYFVLLGDLPANRQVGYLAIGDSRGRGNYIGHFCTSVFNYRENAAALTGHEQAGIVQLFGLFKKMRSSLPRIRLHLIGHSAGAIVHSHLGARAIRQGLNVASVARAGHLGYTLGLRVVVPGLLSPFLALALRIMPHRITTPLIRFLLKPRGARPPHV